MLDEQTAREKLRELFATPDVVKVHQALAAGSDLEALRIVGGTMRDLLLEQRDILAPDQDLDFATPLRPDKVEQLLNEAGIKTIRKGRSFEHGTVIAVLPRGKKSDFYCQFEITSLRRDIKTDGRHAKIIFTPSWKADSNRRDFTINALYGDSQGTIHDYHNGLGDLEERVVRFIGNREERIEEDALRILRFFRFSGLVGETGYIDPNRWCMRAIQSKTHLIDRLSGERVWAELRKILLIPDHRIRNGILESMQTMGVLEAIHPTLTEVKVEKRLSDLEKEYNQEKTFSSIVRLVALLPEGSENTQEIAKRLNFTREGAKLLESISESLRPKGADDIEWLRVLHEKGWEKVLARLSLTAARDGLHLNPSLIKFDWQEGIHFPITGDDVMQELKIAPGPQVGVLLHLVENWWLVAGRKASREACLAQLRIYQAQQETPISKRRGVGGMKGLIQHCRRFLSRNESRGRRAD